MTESIRIAISGGGLAGASLVHALLQYNHLDVHIFEEAGAAIGVNRAALTALDLIGPSAAQSLQNAGAVPQQSVRFMLAQGDRPETQIDVAKEHFPGHRLTNIAHRAAFLRELLSKVPPERMHASKKLERVERADYGDGGPITLHFADGISHECDILVGADGIHSTVRKIILGEDDAAANPRNTGWWCIMALKPYEEARACLGDGYVDVNDASEYGWVGDGTFLMHNVLSGGTLVQFVVTGSDDPTKMSSQWNRMVAAEEVRKLYAEWPPRLRNAVEKLLCDKAEQPAIYLWEHPPARTYVSGPICVTGDAAHATTPWQGSGAGMSIEDSLILSTLLGQAKNPKQACAGLKIYDKLRRGRTQQVVESSRGTGVILTGKGEETGLELEKLRKNALPRWDFIVDFDVKKHREEAVEMMGRGWGSE
ncbi:FAD/NAD(P)-binding domain-containing protein [Apiospora hydei]|uniref:FAD/NAD(P)-binding domain-containing protein n=1 Tax=Apiospora hydei TaxID=1337664 RepID=A0ABR1V6N9_9PEZI